MHVIDLNQLEFIHPTLRTIAEEVRKEFGSQRITSLYRIDDPGVHGQLPLRGIDFSCHNRDYGQVLCNWVNHNWQYDPSRPDMTCAMVHNVGQGLHIHLQVHPFTVRRSA